LKKGDGGDSGGASCERKPEALKSRLELFQVLFQDKKRIKKRTTSLSGTAEKTENDQGRLRQKCGHEEHNSL